MTRSRGKTDANQTPIVRELRKAGCSVQSLADIGKGCPDILVGWHGRTYGPYEVKLPGCELTPDEVAWWDAWNGDGTIVYCAEDVLLDIGAIET
jgi:hypothetical protein